MEAGHVTPRAPVALDGDIAFYERQHRHDLEALELAADLISSLSGLLDDQAIVIADLRREKTILILHARRDRLA